MPNILKDKDLKSRKNLSKIKGGTIKSWYLF